MMADPDSRPGSKPGPKPGPEARPKSRPKSRPGRPKDLRKRGAILDAAKELFGEHGYTGTSMDAVARRASVSKLTVYSHFGGKHNLFRAAVRSRCTELFPEDLYLTGPTRDVEQTLREVARYHARLAISPEAIGMWRAISGNPENGSSQLGELLWEEGPERIHAQLHDFLCRLTEQGELEIDDCDRAATQFTALIRGDAHLKCMLRCGAAGSRDNEREMEANAEAAVALFLRAYGPRNG